ncbi:MAG: PQQ-binding-like beta-propeller repeat protein, partial [Verrucomicrobiota bacterium]
MKLIQHLCLALILSSAVWSTAEDKNGNWPQWRGPTRDGVVATAPWPGTLTKENFQEVWKVDLDPSYSGPIVYGDQVFVTETVDKKQEFVRALDRATGKENWRVGWEGAIKVPFFARANGIWIRSTPACDGERLYVAGIRDVLVCLDIQDGTERWKVDFVEEFKTPVPNFGFVCSPLVIGDHVYVQAGGSLAKVEKKTGNVVWRSLKDGGGMWANAFSSPLLTRIADKDQMIVQTRQKMAGVDVESGDELWSQKIEAFRGMNILTPVVYKEQLFTSAHSGRSELFAIARNESAFSVNRVWENKSTAYMSTPVIIGDHLYMHMKNQRFTCIDLR